MVKKKGQFPLQHTNYFHSLFFHFIFCQKTLFSHALLVGTRENLDLAQSHLCEKWFSAGEIHHNNFLFLVTSAPDFYELLPASLFQLPFVQLKVQLTSIGHYSLGHIHMRERQSTQLHKKCNTMVFKRDTIKMHHLSAKKNQFLKPWQGSANHLHLYVQCKIWSTKNLDVYLPDGIFSERAYQTIFRNLIK